MPAQYGLTTAKWDKQEKRWFTPEGTDLSKLQPWLPVENVRLPEFLRPPPPQDEFALALHKAGLDLQGQAPVMPTPLGVMLPDSLKGKFSFCEYDFTERMEQALDDIAEGKAEYVSVLAPAHQTLLNEVSAFEKATGKICPACGKPMFHCTGKGKNGKPYDFWGCSGWPECKQTL